ncbi:DUF7855 family protein [Halocatena halophila]|uniref:DUF7855 family protein n=1 Tax=Halocatena halophila TaxID=2814576 RepID=UPI002ED243BF
MLLLVTYSRSARQSLRNVRRSHEDVIVRWFGRAALFVPTEFGAFQCLRLRSKHPETVQIERTEPFNEFTAVSPAVRTAVTAYVNREHPATPYRAFASGTEHPSIEEMANQPL